MPRSSKIPLLAPCLCNPLHVCCPAETCLQANHAQQHNVPTTTYRLRDFRQSAKTCPTCAAIVAALTSVDEVKHIIQASVDDLVISGGEPWEGAKEDWEAVGVELMVPENGMAGVEVGDGGAGGVEMDSNHKESQTMIRKREENRDMPTIKTQNNGNSPPRQVINSGRRTIRTSAAQDSSENWRHFNIWRDATDGWETQGCHAIPPLTCHPVRRTDDDEAIAQLKAWIETCDRLHGCVPSQGARAPTRLVKVSDNQIRVVKTSGDLLKYITLSHRWGHNERFTLLKGNTEDMSREIPWNTIPRTYRDAIQVARQLGVDYLWIDTMCIVQDDSEDWRRESTRMKSVYGGSYLNIAAVCSAGSHGGLFAGSTLVDDFRTHEVPEERPSRAEDAAWKQGTLCIRQQPHMTHTAFGNNYRTHSLLLGRGWVLQERVLSPRIVYFDQEELKWECYGGVDCLCGGMLVISNFNIEYRESLGMRKGKRREGKTGRDACEEKPLPIQWMRIAERYSDSGLTFDSDRVVALAGVAEQALRTGQGGKYLAGLWERDLEHQICWEIRDTHRRPSMYLAPSWSWLSVMGSLHYSNRMDYQRWASVIDARITQAECTLADESQETGPVTSGFIKVSGRVVEMEAKLAFQGSDNVPQVFSLTHRASKTIIEYGIEVDYVMTAAHASKLDHMLFLYWGDMWPNRETFLVLKTAAGAQDVETYERLGIFCYEDESEQEEFERVLSWCQLREDIVII